MDGLNLPPISTDLMRALQHVPFFLAMFAAGMAVWLATSVPDKADIGMPKWLFNKLLDFWFNAIPDGTVPWYVRVQMATAAAMVAGELVTWHFSGWTHMVLAVLTMYFGCMYLALWLDVQPLIKERSEKAHAKRVALDHPAGDRAEPAQPQ